MFVHEKLFNKNMFLPGPIQTSHLNVATALPPHDRKSAGKFDSRTSVSTFTRQTKGQFVTLCLASQDEFINRNIIDPTRRLTQNENFRGGSGHSADRQAERGRSAENNSLSVFRGKRFISRLLPDGAGRHTVQTHRSWAKVRY